MFDGSDPCWVPRVPFGADAEQRVRIAQFGDGYLQKTLDGINALDRRWNLTWEARAQDDLLAMDAYLAGRQGHAFPFQDPVTLVTWQVFCDQWSISWDLRRRPSTGSGAGTAAVHYGTLTAQFVKANGTAIAAVVS